MEIIPREPSADALNPVSALARPGFGVSRGQPLPLGATVMPEGVNFSIFSKHATHVTLVLFLPGVTDSVLELPLDARINRTGDVWHLFVSGVTPGVRYGYRIDGPRGHQHRFDSSEVVIDPYARALSAGIRWNEGGQRRGLIVPVRDFEWGADASPRTPIADSVIYQLHVRGFTQHPTSGVHAPGTFAGVREKIPYLKALGITAVELLFVMEIDEHPHDHRIAFFAPNGSYAAGGPNGCQIRELKELVQALHADGIEVLLDMAFNDARDEGAACRSRAFRGIDYHTYYAGAGNALNCDHPVVKDLILDSVRYWVAEMHIDGFRCDLAQVLERIAADPVLFDTKLFADACGTVIREDIHRFVRGERQCKSALALQLLAARVPLLMAGDELGRWEQRDRITSVSLRDDDEASWIDWSMEETNADVLDFARGLIRFRRAHPALRVRTLPSLAEWATTAPLVVEHLVDDPQKPQDELFIAVNMQPETVDVQLPASVRGGRWHGAIDTCAARPDHIAAPGDEWFVGNVLSLPAEAVVVLIAR